MGWTRNDDRMPFHRKWLELSNDAYAMGHRAMVWARSPEAHARPGFVTEKVLRKLSGGLSPRKFAKAVEELVTAGAGAHEHGILESVDGGFLIHDFEHYGAPTAPREPAPAPTDGHKLNRKEAARVAGQASAAARRERNGTAQPSRTSPSNVAPNAPERHPSNVVPNEPIQPIERIPVSPDPIPERTTTIVQDTEAEPLERPERRTVVMMVREEESAGPEPCPRDLFARAQGGGHLRMLADELEVPIWDVEAEARGFVDYWTIGRRMGVRKTDWLGEMRQRIVYRHREGKLVGCGKPPGEVEHDEVAARERRSVSPTPRLGKPEPPSVEDLARIEQIFGPKRVAGGTG